jgi:hypothetical protein
MRTSSATFALALSGMLLLHPSSFAQKRPKLQPEEIVKRHLEAAGISGEAVSHRTSLKAEGTGTTRHLAGGRGGPYSGAATFLSQEHNLFFQIPYADPEYRGELVAYDGQEVRGNNTMLGRFAYQFHRIMEEGLFGGVYSMNWAIKELADRGAKLASKGIAKKDGKELYQLEYRFKRGSDVTTTLFFDADTFHHVMTQYKVVISSGFGLNNSGSTERYTLEEQFGGFEDIDGFTLPREWTIRISSSTTTALVEARFDRIVYNVQINPATFSLK